MASVSAEDLSQWDTQGLSPQEEKIFVSVRLRPLNERETSRNDLSDWECINNTTIIFKKNLPERSMSPAAYTFDRVFGCDCSTKQVYEEGAKEVALSVVSGINSSIFAYGQTSSGKTYTMSGITELAVADICSHIEKHTDREFVIKFSAMEIYNEAVRDLLSADTTPLRLLDDPERGTVVEKLTEEIPRDWIHLQELVAICDAQRQIGETSLNETSSRSHQILRLTIESSAREFLRAERSSTLSASVNFVDLAGSERASQTLSAGARLKEGCHINRSLLTLGTVIRKLSKGRNGHVPYRDSKLTRILQNSLGGNARTAIVCTMSPARSHVEQSRNTLLFASCAKEVSTNAQVNVVMSDKALVKHLQRELARLESELQCAGSTLVTPDSAALIREKELQIEKMDKEIKELIQQRDLAQSRVNDLLQSAEEDQVSRLLADSDQPLDSQAQNACMKEYAVSESLADPRRLDVEEVRTVNTRRDGLHSDKIYLQISDNSEDHFLFDGTSSPLSLSTPKFAGPDPCQGWEEIAQRTCGDSEDICKEVRCIEMEDSGDSRQIKVDAFSSDSEVKEGKLAAMVAGNDNDESSTLNGDKELTVLKQKVLRMQKTIDSLVGLYPAEQSPYSPEIDDSSSKSFKLIRSRSCKAVLIGNRSPLWLEKVEHDENTPPSGVEKDFLGKLDGFHLRYGARSGKLSRRESQTSLTSLSMDEKAQNNVKVPHEGDNTGEQNVVSRVDEVPSEMKPDDDLGASKCSNNWTLEFERLQRQIIELWDACNVPLVHRTYFFILFNGDPSDSVYMEVELRRLSYLKDTLSSGSKSVNGQTLTLVSSLRALNRERDMLSKQVYKKFPEKDRESLFQKWDIGLETKQRRLQLGRRLWTDTKDMEHIKESAAVVAKLVGHIEPAQAPKEMVGLSFSSRALNRRSSSWKYSMSSLY